MMTELIFRNIMILRLGTLLRYLYLRFIKKNKSASYKQLLNQKCTGDIKKDEINTFNNEIINRLYALVFLIVIVIIIAFFTYK